MLSGINYIVNLTYQNYCDPTIVDGWNITSNNIITPTPPTANPGYPSILFFAISDIPHNPAPMISSIVTSSYIVMNLEVSEIVTKDFSYVLFSTSALYLRFANEPSTELFACNMLI